MKNVFPILIIFIFLYSCKPSKIVNAHDIKPFLQESFLQNKINENQAELNFWNNKLKMDTGSYVYLYQLAQYTISRFSLLGNPNDLIVADSFLAICNTKLNHKEPSIYYTLIQNAITQHQFKKGEQYLQYVKKLGGDAYLNNLLSFDIAMELGRYNNAAVALETIGNKVNNFDYLIRNSKLLDHEGKAEQSMIEMERAFSIAKKNNNKKQINWCLTNLADKYSHEGDIEKAYTYYINSLATDSANIYALKGIAKISFAHDADYKQAKEIVNFIDQKGIHPDNILLLAEIAEIENEKPEVEKYNQDFNAIMQKYNFGEMYNKYKIELLLENKATQPIALTLAHYEVKNRATPETYAWLAYALHKNGAIQKATTMLQEFVIEKTFEPEALFIISTVFNKTDKNISTKYSKMCEESKFELGPIKTNEIKKLSS